MPLDPIGISLSDMMLRHVSELIAIPNQWTAKENDYLQKIQRALVQFKQLWELVDDNIRGLTHELRTPLSPIIGYRELIEYTINPPISEQTEVHLSYLHFGGKILLWKVNELVDIHKNTQLAEHQYRNTLSLELISFDLIDRMLDAALDLRLMPDNWTDLQRDSVEELHAALVRLNRYAQVLDAHELANTQLMMSGASLISYLNKLLAYDYKGEQGQKALQTIETLINIVDAKLRYFADKAYTNT